MAVGHQPGHTRMSRAKRMGKAPIGSVTEWRRGALFN